MLCSSLCSPTKWLHNLPASEVWEISLDRCDGHTVLCSEEQKSAVRHQCPGPHLTPINFEQRKKKMGMKHFPEWKSCAPLFVSKLLHRAAVTQEWPQNPLAVSPTGVSLDLTSRSLDTRASKVISASHSCWISSLPWARLESAISPLPSW